MRRSAKRVLSGLALLSCLGLPSTVLHAQPPPAPSATGTAPRPASPANPYLRLSSAAPGSAPSSLQTAVVRYADEPGAVTVDLVAALHLGEASYYSELNRRLDTYDAVLYELVAPTGTRPQGGPVAIDNPVSAVSGVMQSVLGLESQLERINYQRPNFVHADLTPAQLASRMKQRGENWLTLGLAALLEMLRRGQASPGADASTPELLNALGDPKQMKQVFAKTLAAPGDQGLSLGAPLNRLLIQDRNKAALAVLRAQLALGRKRVAIFYGAAHMPDLGTRLTQEFGMKLQSRQYITAWDLTQAGSSKGGVLPGLLRMLQPPSR